MFLLLLLSLINEVYINIMYVTLPVCYMHIQIQEKLIGWHADLESLWVNIVRDKVGI